MRGTTVARSYAEALFELGQKHGQAEAFATAFHQVTDLLEREPRARLFLDTPKIDPEEKKRVVEETLRGRVPQLFINFLKVVVDRGRQRALPAMAREYDAILDESLGRLHVDVTLAREPDERTEEDIVAELSRVTGRKVVLHVRVQPQILGGLVARYEDKVLDGSLRRRLTSLRRHLLTTGFSAS
ncbi:MAG: ATP synthase F1 subunit delta [Gemmatimonadetes bacterium]|nr:ATP synthase F1 subunit delta [Gemmatimonadota bacterium]